MRQFLRPDPWSSYPTRPDHFRISLTYPVLVFVALRFVAYHGWLCFQVKCWNQRLWLISFLLERYNHGIIWMTSIGNAPRTNEKVREGSIFRRKSVQSLSSGPFGHPHAVKYRDGCDKHAGYPFYPRLQPRMYESFGLESERLRYLAVRNYYDFNTVKKPIEIGVLHSCQLIFPSWLFPSWQAVLPTLQLLQYVVQFGISIVPIQREHKKRGTK